MTAVYVRDPAGAETAAIDSVLSLEGKRVLDVGCGQGRLTSFAAERAAFVYAFDPDAERVATARAGLPAEHQDRVRFAVHGAEALDVARERFDVALCGWSLWCVPLEGVVHALKNIHSVLRPSGIVVDTQPVSPHPPVSSHGTMLGTLDMREWLETIDAVDELTRQTIATGLYEVEQERLFTVKDSFDGGLECLDTVRDWAGTRVGPRLAERLRETTGQVTLTQDVRLRVLRAA